MTDPDDTYRVPLSYASGDVIEFCNALHEGRYARLVFAEYDAGGDSYVLTLGRGRALRFNRLRLIDSPDHARAVASILNAWATTIEHDPKEGSTS